MDAYTKAFIEWQDGATAEEILAWGATGDWPGPDGEGPEYVGRHRHPDAAENE